MSFLQSEIMLPIVGILLIVIGAAFRFYVGRRRFNRRGVGGLQQYRSYGRAVISTTFEGFLRLIGLLLILGGLFLCGLYYFNHRAAAEHRGQSGAESEKVEDR